MKIYRRDDESEKRALFSPGYTYMPYNGLVNGDGTYYTNTEEEIGRASCRERV